MNQINKLVVLSTIAASLVSVSAHAQTASAATDETNASKIVDQLRSAQHADALTQAGRITLDGIVVAKGCAAKAVIAIDPAARSAAIYANDGGPATAAEAVSAAGAWQRDASGIARPVTLANDAQNLASDAYWATGGLANTRWPVQVKYLAPVQLGGVSTDVLSVTPAGGKATEVWISRASHLPLQWARRDEGGRVVTAYGDFREVDGALLPFQQTVTAVDGTTRAYALQNVRTHLDLADLQTLTAMPTQQPKDTEIRGGRTTRVAMHMAGQPYIDVYINGRGPFNFRVDTSGSLTLSAQAARKLGLPLFGGDTADVQYAMLGDLRIGEAHVHQQNVQVRELEDDKAGLLPRRVDGIVGAEIMERFVTTFDFRNQQLTLALQPGQGDLSVPMLTQTAAPGTPWMPSPSVKPASMKSLPSHSSNSGNFRAVNFNAPIFSDKVLPHITLAVVHVTANSRYHDQRMPLQGPYYIRASRVELPLT